MAQEGGSGRIWKNNGGWQGKARTHAHTFQDSGEIVMTRSDGNKQQQQQQQQQQKQKNKEILRRFRLLFAFPADPERCRS